MKKLLLSLTVIPMMFAIQSMAQEMDSRIVHGNSDNQSSSGDYSIAAAAIPCDNFNGSNPGYGWVSQNVTATFTTTNSDDGTTILVLQDNSGTSSYNNTTDYHNLGQVALGSCLCFDESLIQVSGSTGLPYLPRIYLTDGINQIRFIANTGMGITPDSSWHHFCAPIEHCNGTTLPSNASGHWEFVTAGMTCSDFNNVIDNSTQLNLTVDVNSSPSEKVGYDNICVVNCHPCDPSFTYCASTNTPYTYNFTANNSNQISYNWVINGVPAGNAPSISYTFPGPGSFEVCLHTANQTDKCDYCMKLCVNENSPSKQMKAISQVATQSDNNIQTTNAVIPNPTNTGWNLKFNASEAGKVSVKVIDPTGRTISAAEKNVSKGEHVIYQDATKLDPGIYFIEIKGAGVQFRRKAVKN